MREKLPSWARTEDKAREGKGMKSYKLFMTSNISKSSSIKIHSPKYENVKHEGLMGFRLSNENYQCCARRKRVKWVSVYVVIFFCFLFLYMPGGQLFLELNGKLFLQIMPNGPNRLTRWDVCRSIEKLFCFLTNLKFRQNQKLWNSPPGQPNSSSIHSLIWPHSHRFDVVNYNENLSLFPFCFCSLPLRFEPLSLHFTEKGNKCVTGRLVGVSISKMH